MISSQAAAELRRGWPIILAAIVGLGTGLGSLPIYTLGAFTKPLGDAFGWSRAEVQAIFTWMTLGNLVAAPVLGLLIDRVGVRRVTLASTACQAAGYVAFALLARSLPSFYTIAFITAIVGVGTVPITWTRVIVQWFDAARGLALGLALVGTGLGATFLPSLATWMLQAFGWRSAYLGLAALPALVGLPVAFLLLHDRPPTAVAGAPRAGERPPADSVGVATALAGYRFWVLNAAFFLVGGCLAGLNGHLIPLLTDAGMPAMAAARIAGAAGISVVAGRLLTGYLSDRFWAPAVGVVMLVLPAASCLVLSSPAVGAGASLAAAVLLGLAVGAEFDLMAFLTSRYFGPKHYGLLYSVIYAIFRVATGLGPLAFGYMFDRHQSYGGVLTASAALIVSGALLLLTLGAYPHSVQLFRSSPARPRRCTP